MKLKEWRERRGMTQAELARKMPGCVSQQNISYWEKQGRVDSAMLPFLCRVLRCSVDDIIGVDEAT